MERVEFDWGRILSTRTPILLWKLDSQGRNREGVSSGKVRLPSGPICWRSDATVPIGRSGLTGLRVRLDVGLAMSMEGTAYHGSDPEARRSWGRLLSYHSARAAVRNVRIVRVPGAIRTEHRYEMPTIRSCGLVRVSEDKLRLKITSRAKSRPMDILLSGCALRFHSPRTGA